MAVWRAEDDIHTKPIKVCPECDSIIALSATECPDCGYVFPAREVKIAPTAATLPVLSPKVQWLLVHGVSYTITAANHVIHLSRWWNPAVEDQCNDRIYRIGQEKSVTIHIPMAVHPIYGDKSFDKKLNDLMARKRELSRGLLAPPESNEDLEMLVNGLSIG